MFSGVFVGDDYGRRRSQAPRRELSRMTNPTVDALPRRVDAARAQLFNEESA